MVKKCDKFHIKELVSKKVYDYYTPRYGENFLWGIFSDDIKYDLDYIAIEWRKIHNSGVIINDWMWGGQYQQSGLRSNVDSIVANKNTPYLSGHVLALAFDMKPQNKKYKEFFNFVYNLIKTKKLKCIKRLEDFKHTPTWVHGDGLKLGNYKNIVFEP